MIARVNPQYIYIFSLVNYFHILDHHPSRLYSTSKKKKEEEEAGIYIPGLIVTRT